MVRQFVTTEFRPRVQRAPQDTALVIGDPPLEGSKVFQQLPGAAAEATAVGAVPARERIRDHRARRRRCAVAHRAFELVRPPLSHPPHRRARRLRVRAGKRREEGDGSRPRQWRLPHPRRVRAAAGRSRSGLHQLLPSRKRRRVRTRRRRGVLAAGGQRRVPTHSDGRARGRGRRLGGRRPGGQGVRAALLHGNARGTGIRPGGARRSPGNLRAVRLRQHLGRLSVLRRSRLLDEADGTPRRRPDVRRRAGASL